VLNKGAPQGYTGIIGRGGHIHPEERLPIPEWNQAQKKPTKKKASEIKNNLKPIFNPRATIEV